MPRKKIDYEALVGKEVVFIHPDRGTTKYLAIVTGIDPSLGITIQEKETNEYLFCSNGPLSPVTKEIDALYGKVEGEDEFFEKLFLKVRDMIIDGVVDGRILLLDLQRAKQLGTEPGPRHCAFAQ